MIHIIAGQISNKRKIAEDIYNATVKSQQSEHFILMGNKNDKRLLIRKDFNIRKSIISKDAYYDTNTKFDTARDKEVAELLKSEIFGFYNNHNHCIHTTDAENDVLLEDNIEAMILEIREALKEYTSIIIPMHINDELHSRLLKTFPKQVKLTYVIRHPYMSELINRELSESIENAFESQLVIANKIKNKTGVSIVKYEDLISDGKILLQSNKDYVCDLPSMKKHNKFFTIWERDNIKLSDLNDVSYLNYLQEIFVWRDLHESEAVEVENFFHAICTKKDAPADLDLEEWSNVDVFLNITKKAFEALPENYIIHESHSTTEYMSKPKDSWEYDFEIGNILPFIK